MRGSSYDVIVVGGGPAGSTCAWKLGQSGLRALVIDRSRFPRVKLCAGWITPSVLTSLELDREEYRRRHTLEEFHGFNLWRLSGKETRADYGRPVGYGIIRSEFDHYLLKRSGAAVVEGVAVESIRREPGEVVVNETWSAPLLIGAGGHYCPVARHLGVVLGGEKNLSTLELELPVTSCGVSAAYPEIVFFDDIRGYGWCFRKGGFLSIGVGRTRPQHLRKHLAVFLERLKERGKLPRGLRIPESNFRGHAYKFHHLTPRPYVDDRVLLVGDAAGLAFNFSAEGIRPAVESALAAQRVILQAGGDYRRERLLPYRDLLWRIYGRPITGWRFRLMEAMPPATFQIPGRALLGVRLLARRVVIDRLFLRRHRPGGLPTPRASV